MRVPVFQGNRGAPNYKFSKAVGVWHASEFVMSAFPFLNSGLRSCIQIL